MLSVSPVNDDKLERRNGYRCRRRWRTHCRCKNLVIIGVTGVVNSLSSMNLVITTNGGGELIIALATAATMNLELDYLVSHLNFWSGRRCKKGEERRRREENEEGEPKMIVFPLNKLFKKVIHFSGNIWPVIWPGGLNVLKIA
nr:hypothetical protein Iba_chr07cCG6080 [Ipomoea batatas]